MLNNLNKKYNYNLNFLLKLKKVNINILEKKKINNCIKNYKKKKEFIFICISIQKKINSIYIVIYIEINIKNILLKYKKKYLKKKRYISFFFYFRKIEKEIYAYPKILAEFLGLQFKNKIFFNKIIKKIIELVEQTHIKKIKIKFSGSSNKKNIYIHTEWIKKFKIITIKNYIYIYNSKNCFYLIKTIFGIININIIFYSIKI
nr:ribosomal protein S3 [Thismia rodwayi]